MNAVLYARTSGEDRGKATSSLAGQLDMCREYAEQNGWAVVAELADDAVSGSRLDAPQLNVALDMAHAGRFKILVVREIDRLARSLAKQLVIEEELKQLGVRVEYVLGDYPDTPEGNFMKNVRATVAEYEREVIRIRLERGRHRKIKAGSTMLGGPAPYGYRSVVAEDGCERLEVVEEQAAVVREIFERYLDGHPMSAILEWLDSLGIPTAADLPEHSRSQKKRKFGRWGSASVYTILRNETYSGKWHYGKRSGRRDLAVEVPAIVSREVWLATQAKRKDSRHIARNNKHPYLLLRRITCARCDMKMGGHSAGRNYIYYRCAVRAHPKSYGGRSCDMPHFRAPIVDDKVWEWLGGILSQPNKLRAELERVAEEEATASKPKLSQLGIIEGKLVEARGKLTRAAELYIAGSWDRDFLDSQKQQLEELVTGFEVERDRLVAELEGNTAGQLLLSLDDITIDTRRLDKARGDELLEERRWWVDATDLRVTLDHTPDGPVAHVSCVLGKEVISLQVNSPIADNGTEANARPRTSPD
jgi:site-specific DNA recombinase